MTSATMKARIVRVKIEEGKTGLFYATSPDLNGLLVAKPNLTALDDAIPNAIQDLYAACGVSVVVTKAQDDDPDFFPWIAIPAEAARIAMARSQQAA
jgi:hypothetical protein